MPTHLPQTDAGREASSRAWHRHHGGGDVRDCDACFAWTVVDSVRAELEEQRQLFRDVVSELNDARADLGE